jgi:ABC-type transporter Mla subunit MlaD
MPAENTPAPRRAAGELLREIDSVDAQIVGLLELLDAAGERRLNARSIYELLNPVRTRLADAADDLNRLLGR